ncbi:MAG: hypothetical protein PHP17_02490 [Candidatus Omnitrophica bacterium]|nr:hypothetical protein [Candidatus Omnitrophota bacterium]
MASKIKKGRPKKVVKYTKTINVRLTREQWIEILNWAEKAHLEPSVYIRKIVLDFLNIHYSPQGAEAAPQK